MKLNLGEFIKKKRLEKNLTMQQLADMIGKHKSFIFKLENNQVKSLKHEMIEPLAKALDVPVIEMFNGFDVDAIKVPESEKGGTLDDFLNELNILMSKYTIENPEFFIEFVRQKQESFEKICKDNEKDDKKD